jgi:hypothetical protein
MQMTDVKNSRLYKTLCKAVRKQDHAELLRMLEMVKPDLRDWDGFDGERLYLAFSWFNTPQGWEYWENLCNRLQEAGHDCW